MAIGRQSGNEDRLNEQRLRQVIVRVQDGTIWLSQKNIASLFGTSTDNISLHLRNIYAENELAEKSTTEDFSVVQTEGNREIKRNVKHYNLDAIIKGAGR